MTPGIGLMKRRLEKERDAVLLLQYLVIAKKYNIKPENIKTLETKYHSDAGDWYMWPLDGKKKKQF